MTYARGGQEVGVVALYDILERGQDLGVMPRGISIQSVPRQVLCN